MKLNFTILSVALIVVFLFTIYNEQLLNRLCFFKKKRDYEDYRSIIERQPHPLTRVLNSLNNELINRKISVIEKHSSFGRGNFTENIRAEVMPTINRILNDVNNLGNLRVKFNGLDRIEKIQDNMNNTQYLVAFFAHNVNEFSSTKLIINFFRDADGIISISSLKKESDTMSKVPNLIDKLITYNHTPKETNYKQYKRVGALDDNQTNNTSYGAPFSAVGNDIQKKAELNKKFIFEPCHYNLHLWDSRGVNRRFKIDSKCKNTNNSQRPAPLNIYANPTVFSPILNEPHVPEYST